MKRYVNAADRQYEPAEGDPPRLLKAWADLKPGGDFYLPYDAGPPGYWMLPSPAGFRIDKTCTFRGDGPNGEDVGLRFWADPAVPDLRGTGDSHGLVIAADWIEVRDLVLSNNRGNVRGRGCGIFTDELAVRARSKFANVQVFYAGDCGLKFAPRTTPGEGFFVEPEFERCTFFGCGGDGVHLGEGGTVVKLSEVTCDGNGGYGFFADGQDGGIWHVVAEGNGAGGEVASDIRVENSSCSELRFWAEGFALGAVTAAVELVNCRGIEVIGEVYDWSGKPDLTGVRLVNSRCCVVRPLSLLPKIKYAVWADHPSCDNVIFPQDRGKVAINSKRNTIL